MKKIRIYITVGFSENSSFEIFLSAILNHPNILTKGNQLLIIIEA